MSAKRPHRADDKRRGKNKSGAIKPVSASGLGTGSGNSLRGLFNDRRLGSGKRAF